MADLIIRTSERSRLEATLNRSARSPGNSPRRRSYVSLAATPWELSVVLRGEAAQSDPSSLPA